MAPGQRLNATARAQTQGEGREREEERESGASPTGRQTLLAPRQHATPSSDSCRSQLISTSCSPIQFTQPKHAKLLCKNCRNMPREGRGVLSGGRAYHAGSDPAGKPGPMDALNLKLFYPTYFRRHDYCLPCPACNCFVVSILFSSTFVELFAIYTHKQQLQQQQPELAVGRSLCQ